MAVAGLLMAVARAAEQPWVAVAADGTLRYRADERGNTVPDFSRAGYGGGGVALPEVAAVLTLEPRTAGDDGARVQAALDEAGRRTPDARGFRGAVVLRRGEYRVAGTLAIRAGGVVLRGEGDGPDGTVIRATGTAARTLITVGAERSARREIAGSRRRITDDHVPWSATSFAVESTEGLAVGARVIVHRPSTAAWIAALGMDRIRPRPNAPADATKQWAAGGMDLHLERTIVALDGRRVTLDAPVMNALEARFGGGSVYRATWPRIAQCGVEGLRLVSDYEKGKETEDEAHAQRAVELGAVEHAWVRRVTAWHFSHGLEADGAAIFTTFSDCAHLDPVSKITGGRRYSFSLNGQFGLAVRCHSRGARHTFVTGSRVAGPNVFLEGTAVQSHADSGPHHRWAVGSLYDGIADDNQIRAEDRQYAGSGHGWAGAQQVFWNCTAKTIVVQRPPTAQNWAIGCRGRWVKGSWAPEAPDGAVESPGRPVLPRSLYRAQLAARLGPAAVVAALGEPEAGAASAPAAETGARPGR